MLETLVENTKWMTPLLVGSVMSTSCIAPQTYSWKTESIVSTAYQKVDEVVGTEVRYKIATSFSDAGMLSISVKKQDYDVGYDVLQAVETQKQRQYAYGRSKAAATWANVGLGTVALGALLEAVTETKDCFSYDNVDDLGYGSSGTACKTEQGSPGAHIVVGAGIAITGVSGFVFWNGEKKSRPTKNYQTVEVPLDTRTQKQASEHVMSIIPAISTPLDVASSYFTIDETGHAIKTKTNVMGNVAIQLSPSSENFAFTVEGIGQTDAAQQLHEAGFSEAKYLPLLEQAAVPVTYDVTIETKATDGKNAKVTVPVKGYEISQKALERVVMEL